MKKNGFISVTVIYTFFLVFLSLMLYIVTNLVVNRNLLNNMKTTIKNELNDSNFNRYLINHCNDLIRMDDSYNNSIKDNSYRFGFILRYPEDKVNVTGYSYEAWHFRYVGKEIAKYVYENNITFEEYYAYYIEK